MTNRNLQVFREVKIPLIIPLILLCVSCTEFSADKAMKNQYDDSKGLFIAMHVIIPEEEEVSLMYLSKDINKWSPDALIKKKINGKDYVQVVSFQLQKGVVPTKLRIDLGSNKNINEIDLYKLVLRNANFEIEINRDLIYKYFVFNKYVDKDSIYPKLSLSEQNGIYDPIMVSTDYFEKLMIKKLNLN
ncbi:hypothetical protein [Flagellimonas pelagia]|nr:hypothetical protein [Allomuricauda maritima]TXJ94678.1 hypothetical protein FQ017_09585 [Allomuricauda maritima]